MGLLFTFTSPRGRRPDARNKGAPEIRYFADGKTDPAQQLLYMAEMSARSAYSSRWRRALDLNFIERAGVWYLRRLAQNDLRDGRYTRAQLDDRDYLRAIRLTTWSAMGTGFVLGALSSAGTFWVDQVLLGEAWWYRVFWVSFITLILTVIELSLLGWTSLRLVYFNARMTGHNVEDERASAFLNEQTLSLLARAALEVPDPVPNFLGIDPLAKVSRKRLIFVGIVYKLKVFLSNFGARMLLTWWLGPTIWGLSMMIITIPITGLWNAWMIRKVSREARLRLFGNLLARYVVSQIIELNRKNGLSPVGREGCVRAVANSLILTQQYHPNMLLLLVELYHALEIEAHTLLDNWQLFLQTLEQAPEHERYLLLDVLCIAAAFDGHISSLERKHLRQAFGEYTPLYFQRMSRLRKFLTSGRLQAAKQLSVVDFQPG